MIAGTLSTLPFLSPAPFHLSASSGLLQCFAPKSSPRPITPLCRASCWAQFSWALTISFLFSQLPRLFMHGHLFTSHAWGNLEPELTYFEATILPSPLNHRPGAGQSSQGAREFWLLSHEAVRKQSAGLQRCHSIMATGCPKKGRGMGGWSNWDLQKMACVPLQDNVGIPLVGRLWGLKEMLHKRHSG